MFYYKNCVTTTRLMLTESKQIGQPYSKHYRLSIVVNTCSYVVVWRRVACVVVSPVMIRTQTVFYLKCFRLYF